MCFNQNKNPNRMSKETENAEYFGPEWEILELICHGTERNGNLEKIIPLFTSKNLNWGELIERAIRHRMLPALAEKVISLHLGVHIPDSIRYHLFQHLNINKWKIAIYYKVAMKLIKALQNQNIRFVCTKGITFESTIYNGVGSRELGDIDFMIHPKDQAIAIKTLKELNYEQGLLKEKENKIMPFDRKKLMRFQLFPDHIPHYSIKTNDPLIKAVPVDYAFSVTWARSQFQIPMEIVLKEIIYQKIPGASNILMPCLNPTFQFVFTILHLYREAKFINPVKMEKALNLMKFTDVLRIWNTYNSEIITNNFSWLIKELGIVEPIAWVLEQTDIVFGTRIQELVGCPILEKEFLVEFPDGKIGKWKCSMKTLLDAKMPNDCLLL